jgi:hypothetical protein
MGTTGPAADRRPQAGEGRAGGGRSSVTALEETKPGGLMILDIVAGEFPRQHLAPGQVTAPAIRLDHP